MPDSTAPTVGGGAGLTTYLSNERDPVARFMHTPIFMRDCDDYDIQVQNFGCEPGGIRVMGTDELIMGVMGKGVIDVFGKLFSRLSRVIPKRVNTPKATPRPPSAPTSAVLPNGEAQKILGAIEEVRAATNCAGGACLDRAKLLRDKVGGRVKVYQAANGAKIHGREWAHAVVEHGEMIIDPEPGVGGVFSSAAEYERAAISRRRGKVTFAYDDEPMRAATQGPIDISEASFEDLND